MTESCVFLSLEFASLRLWKCTLTRRIRFNSLYRSGGTLMKNYEKIKTRQDGTGDEITVCFGD